MKKVFVITGATGHIGKACALRLSKYGTLLLADNNEEKLKQIANDLKKDNVTAIEYLTVDISKQEQVKLLVEKCEEIGQLVGLVHTDELTEANGDWKRIMEVNAIGTAYLLKEFYKLANDATSAVMFSSTAAYLVPVTDSLKENLKHPLEENFIKKMEAASQETADGSYPLSKISVMEMVKNLAFSWGEKGARLNSLSPSLTVKNQQIENKSEFIESIPLRREGNVDEVVNAVEFLISDASSYITGIDLLVDGGLIAHTNKPLIR